MAIKLIPGMPQGPGLPRPGTCYQLDSSRRYTVRYAVRSDIPDAPVQFFEVEVVLKEDDRGVAGTNCNPSE